MLFCLLLIVFVTYNIVILYKFGIPSSLSETSYMWLGYNNRPWYFSLLCILMGASIMPLWFEVNNGDFQFLTFIACMCLIFAGASPLFRGGLDKPVHYTSAMIAMACVIAWFFITRAYTLIVIESGIFIMSLLLNKKNTVYWSECGIIILLISQIFFMQT